MSDRCASCDAPLDLGAATVGHCPACGTLVFSSGERGVAAAALVVHESEAWAERIGAALQIIGLWPVHLANGASLGRLLGRREPVAMVLDVAAMPTAFEIVEDFRAHASGGNKPIILVASVFNRTAYKRRPSSLYGADDYVEQHHVGDLLPRKLADRLGLPKPPVGQGELLARAEEAAQAMRRRGGTDAVALAQTIVADIALYHEREVIHAAGGRIEDALHAALAEGERLLREYVPDAAGKPIDAAFAELLDKMRRRRG